MCNNMKARSTPCSRSGWAFGPGGHMADEVKEVKEVKEKKKFFLAREVSTMTGIIALVVFLLLCLGGVGGFYYVASENDKKAQEVAEQEAEQYAESDGTNTEQNQNQNQNQNTKNSGSAPAASDFGTSSCPTTLTAAEITELATWERNTNTFYGFSYYVPNDWSVFVSDTTENVPEEITYHDNDFQSGFQSFEYLLDWKAAAIYHAYVTQSTQNLQVACSNATIKYARVTEQPNLRMYEVNFTANGKKHQIFYFYKSLGSASLDSDFGEQFRLLLKTIEFDL